VLLAGRDQGTKLPSSCSSVPCSRRRWRPRRRDTDRAQHADEREQLVDHRERARCWPAGHSVRRRPRYPDADPRRVRHAQHPARRACRPRPPNGPRCQRSSPRSARHPATADRYLVPYVIDVPGGDHIRVCHAYRCRTVSLARGTQFVVIGRVRREKPVARQTSTG
jgi:hypothetical protein